MDIRPDGSMSFLWYQSKVNKRSSLPIWPFLKQPQVFWGFHPGFLTFSIVSWFLNRFGNVKREKYELRIFVWLERTQKQKNMDSWNRAAFSPGTPTICIQALRGLLIFCTHSVHFIFLFFLLLLFLIILYGFCLGGNFCWTAVFQSKKKNAEI